MPTDVTTFGAKYLVFIAAVVAAAVVVYVLYPRPRLTIVRWAIATCVMLVLSYAAARVVGAIYNDPRPFVTGHFHPLISHAADNGFPSDHALLAAAVVAAVGFAAPIWAPPFLVLAVAVDWSRVGAGIHHPIDVIASSVIVLVAAGIAWLIAPLLVRWLLPYLSHLPGFQDLSTPPGQRYDGGTPVAER